MTRIFTNHGALAGGHTDRHRFLEGESLELLRRGVGKGGGVDLVKGFGGVVAKVRVCQGVGEGWDGCRSARAHLAEGKCRIKADASARRRVQGVFRFRTVQVGDEERDRNLRLEIGKRKDCVHLDVWVNSLRRSTKRNSGVRSVETVGDYRYQNLGGVAEVGHYADGIDGFQARWVLRVCSNGKERPESVCSETAQGACGFARCGWPVSVIQEAAQIVEGWQCSFSQNGEDVIGSSAKLLRSWVQYPAGELAGEWEVFCSVEPIANPGSPLLWLVLNPLPRERKSRNSDVVNGVCCLFIPIILDAVEAQIGDPVAEGVAVVKGLRGCGCGWEEGKERQQRADGANEKRLLLSHTGTLPRRGLFLTGESPDASGRFALASGGLLRQSAGRGMLTKDCGGAELGLDAVRVVCVCTNCQQRGDSVRSKSRHSRDGCESRKWVVRFVHEAAQIIQGWQCFFPKDQKGHAAPVEEAVGSSDRGVAPLVGESEPGSGGPFGELDFPSRWKTLNPFDEERGSGSADMVNGVCCFVEVWAMTAEAGGTEDCNPVIEGMSVVGWLRCGGCVYKDGNEGERCGNNADEEGSPVSHARTLARTEGFLTGERGTGSGLGSEPSTLNSQLIRNERAD